MADGAPVAYGVDFVWVGLELGWDRKEDVFTFLFRIIIIFL